jgi:hypothetical protein
VSSLTLQPLHPGENTSCQHSVWNTGSVSSSLASQPGVGLNFLDNSPPLRLFLIAVIFSLPPYADCTCSQPSLMYNKYLGVMQLGHEADHLLSLCIELKNMFMIPLLPHA